MKSALTKGLCLLAITFSFLFSSSASDSQAAQRAAYWKEKGYSFDPNYMTAWSMDQKVHDIERGKFWKERGYNFDPNYMTAWSMDQKAHDIERSKFWKEKGYSFDPNYMTAWSMDQKVHDIERGKFWKERGYNFDPNYMTAWSMDQKAHDIERSKFWKEKGYSFDPNYMTAWSMDAAAAQNQPGHNPSPAYVQVPSRPTEQSALPLTSPGPGRGSTIVTSPSIYPSVGENGSYYGEPNAYGVPKTVYVNGYYRKDGTYVRSHFRSSPRR